MATYGSGQMLGSGINPESFKQDYSGFTRAAEMQAQGLSNLGGSIAGAIKDYGQAKQERKKLDAGIKATVTGIESAIKMGDSLGIDVKSSLTPYLNKINDPNVTPIEAAAYAQEASSAINNILNFGMKANQLGMEQDQNIRAAKIRQAEIEAAANKPGSIENIAVPGGTQQMVRNPRTGVLEPIKVAGLTDTSTSALGNLPDALKPFAKDFETAGAKYGVPPVILAAISMHETGNGTSSAFRNKNNAMGISNASGPVEVGSVAESIDKMARLLGKGINEGTGPYANVKSIADIANIYAPPGAGNDPRNLNQFWTQGVTSNIQKLSENQAEQVKPTAEVNQKRIGFAPEKTAGSETYRPFTQEEIARYGSDGQVSSTGKVYPIRPPTGTKFTTNPDGSVTYETGAGVGVKEEKQKMAKENATDKAISLISDLNYLSDKAKSMTPGTVGALGRIVAEKIPATDQAENKQVIDRVRSSLTLENLQAMRNNNPTGAALGTVSDKDTKLVADSATALSNAQSPEAFQKEIIRLKNLQHDIIYGSERVLKNKLEKGEIKQADFDNAMAKAPAEYIDENGVIKSRKIQPIIPSSNSESVYEKYLQK
jgi:hypothetical protein